MSKVVVNVATAALSLVTGSIVAHMGAWAHSRGDGGLFAVCAIGAAWFVALAAAALVRAYRVASAEGEVRG